MSCVRIKAILLVILVILSLVFSSFSQENKTVYSSNSNGQNRIALTFDDGPHPKITPKIIDILDKHNVKATFFVIGVNIDYYPEPLVKAVESGHEIGIHTNSHSILKSVNREMIANEINLCKEKIFNITGETAYLLRPPCGLYDNELIKFAEENGNKIILWNIDTHDWSHNSSKSITNLITSNAKGGDIILFHDYISGENHTAEALNNVIPILKKMGYEFVTVSQLLSN